MAAAGGGPRFSAPPLTRLFLLRCHPGSRKELSRRPRPAREAPRFPPPSRAVPGPRRPRCSRPRSVRPRCRPHYLSSRPVPTVRGSWARAGRPPSRSARPGERSAASSRADLRGHRRAPSRPALGPRPGRRRSRGRRGNGTAAAAAAAATEPGRGEGGISPQAGSAPPASPPPPATSTPSLAPSLAPRALPLNRSESAKERGNKKKNPPARARRGGGRGGAERSAEPLPPQGTVPCSASRWRCGHGRGAEQRRDLYPPRPRLTPTWLATGRVRLESWGAFGSSWERRGP